MRHCCRSVLILESNSARNILQESMAKTRTSVSAEAYGQWNQKKAFTPPDHPKTDEQKQRLKQTLNKSFMFSALEEKDMQLVLGAMKECKVEAR